VIRVVVRATIHSIKWGYKACSGRAANSLRSNSAAQCPAHTLCLTKSHGWRGADHPPGSPPPCQFRKWYLIQKHAGKSFQHVEV